MTNRSKNVKKLPLKTGNRHTAADRSIKKLTSILIVEYCFSLKRNKMMKLAAMSACNTRRVTYRDVRISKKCLPSPRSSVLFLGFYLSILLPILLSLAYS